MTNITVAGLPAKTGTIEDGGYWHLTESGVDKKATIAQLIAKLSSQYSSDINSFLISANKAEGRANLSIDRRVTVDNANYTILATDKVVAQIGTMSAARTFSLPPANTMNAGAEIIVIDESGSVNGTNKITVQRNGTDTIDGATSIDVDIAYGFIRLICDGSNSWKVANNNAVKATQTEVDTGTNDTKFITPLKLYTNKGYFMIVEDQKSSGTAGGSPTTGARNIRTLNTVVTNTITGASLSSNQVTLPIGKYYIKGYSVGTAVNGHKLFLRNITDSTDDLIGSSGSGSTSIGYNALSHVEGVVNITASKVFQLEHYFQSNGAGNAGMGYASNSGSTEIYSRLIINKL